MPKPLFKILYEDNHLLVVVKPASMPSQADESGDPDLLTLAKEYIKVKYKKPGDVWLGLVHRLDRPVSGVMVLARTSKAASRLSEQFRDGTVQKRYLALVESRVEGEGVCVDYLHKHNREVRIVRETHPEGKRAELAWKSIGIDGKTSLLEIDLKTGRPHQIRIQLCKRQMTIRGDFRYHSKNVFDRRNMALHAFGLALNHPTRGTRMVFTEIPGGVWKSWFQELVRERVRAFKENEESGVHDAV